MVDRNTKQIDAGKTVILSSTTGTAVIPLILTPVVKGNFVNKGRNCELSKVGNVVNILNALNLYCKREITMVVLITDENMACLAKKILKG